MPFGIYLRYFLKKREYWKRAFIISFLLTLFYEVTQVTGVYGIFNCAYRIFDVDDLMLNSAGAWLGFFLAPIVWALFPSHEAVQAKAAEIAKNDIVKPLSILLAIIIDLFIVQLILVVVGAVVPNNSIFEFFYKVHNVYIAIWSSSNYYRWSNYWYEGFTLYDDKCKGQRYYSENMATLLRDISND